MALYLRQLPLGPMKNFVYLVGPEHGTEALVVDPAWDVGAILGAAAEDGRTLVGAFVSHCHHDHINGLPDLLAAQDLPVYAQREELAFSPELQRVKDAVVPLSPGGTVAVGSARFRALHTPGHTPGSQCLHAGDALVSGDTLFVNGCGRCDLKGSDPAAMYRSISQVLLQLPRQTVLFPGHDYGDVPVSSLEREDAHNPFFQFADVESFVRFRMTPRR